MNDQKKQARIDEVSALLADFEKQHFPHSADLAGYTTTLWEQVGRKRNYVITGGSKEVWASAVVYVIARLNFLFDRQSTNYLSPDIICNFFGTKKGTVSAKAAEIEKACRIRTGHAGLCSEELSDSFTFVELSNGMVLTKRMAKEMGILKTPIGIGSPIAEAPSHTTVSTDHVYGGSAVVTDKLYKED